jgi:hypothetical protein
MAWGMSGMPNRSGNSKLPTGLRDRVPHSSDLSRRQNVDETVAARQKRLRALPVVTDWCGVFSGDARNSGDPPREGRQAKAVSTCILTLSLPLLSLDKLKHMMSPSGQIEIQSLRVQVVAVALIDGGSHQVL